MKGLETVPIKFILVSILILFIVSIGYTQMNTFLRFKIEKEFKEDTSNLAIKMKNLKSLADFGAFTTANLRIPANGRFILDFDNDTVTSNTTSNEYTVDLKEYTLNITAFNDAGDVSRNGTAVLEEGEYNIRLYYGRLSDEELKDLTVLFE